MIRQLGTFLAAAALVALPALSAHAAGDAAAGKTTFETLCVTCHGPLGKGDGPAGVALTPPPRDFSKGDFKYDADKDGKAGTDADLMLIVKNGAGAYGGSPLMAPWGHLSEAELQNVVAYVRTLKK
jgi:mono/diheme cytochrome c family protein